jgi:rhamnogalacturonan endolyase
MHDHTYRMGICWQNTAYNQPPHLGYYLPDAMQPLLLEKEFTVNMGEEFELETKTRYVKSVTLKTSILPDGTKKSYLLPDGMTRSFDSNSRIYTLKGITDQAGDYQIAVGLTQLGGGSVADTITIHSLNTTGIYSMQNSQCTMQDEIIFDLQGRQQKALKPGINIIRQGNRARKVFVK